MKNKEVTVINPMQLRIPPEMKEVIVEEAKKAFRTPHSEILYRLQLAERVIKAGVVHA